MRFEFELADPEHLDSLLENPQAARQRLRRLPPRSREERCPRAGRRGDPLPVPQGNPGHSRSGERALVELVGRFAALAQRVRFRPRRQPDASRTRTFSAAARETRPTWSQRRCTSSRTRAAATSRCVRKARPRSCAPIVQHRPSPPFKAWYAAPMFRYERPQAGRFRQHHQLGVEMLGTDDPDGRRRGDRAAGRAVLRPRLVVAVELRVNSLGDDDVRSGLPRAAARATSRRTTDELCDEHRYKWAVNPLRVLDCKRPECVAGDAPGRRGCATTLCERLPAPFRRCARGPRPARHRLRAGRLPRPGPRLLHPHHLRVRRVALDSLRTASAGAAATTGWSPRSAARRRPGVGFGERASSGSCSPATPRESCPRRPASSARSTCSSSTRPASGDRARAHPRAAGGGPRRRPGLRRALDEGAAEGGRPLGRASWPASSGAEELAAGARSPSGCCAARGDAHVQEKVARDGARGRASRRDHGVAMSGRRPGRRWCPSGCAPRYCGTLASRRRGQDGQRLRLGRTPARARRAPRLRRPPRPHRDHPVRRRRRPRRCGQSTSCA